jgi:hypothetical protein
MAPLPARRAAVAVSTPPAIGERRRRQLDPYPMPRVSVHRELARCGDRSARCRCARSAWACFCIEAECNALADNSGDDLDDSAGRRRNAEYRVRLAKRHYVTTVISTFRASPISVCSSSSGSCLLRGNGGGHAESDQNHNRHCDDELACSGILAGERNGRSAKAGVRNHVQLISADPGPATGLLTSPDPRHIHGKIRNVRSPRRPLAGACSSRDGYRADEKPHNGTVFEG